MRYVEMLQTHQNRISVSKLLEGYSAKDRNYTVQEGDSLSRIAARLNIWFGIEIDWEELAGLNKLENPDLIYPGQVLKIFA